MGQWHGTTELSFRSFALAGGPFGFDLYDSLDAGCAVAEAAPWPIFGAGAQPSTHRVGVNVMQLLYKLRVVADVEIVVALLPEVFGLADQGA